MQWMRGIDRFIKYNGCEHCANAKANAEKSTTVINYDHELLKFMLIKEMIEKKPKKIKEVKFERSRGQPLILDQSYAKSEELEALFKEIGDKYSIPFDIPSSTKTQDCYKEAEKWIGQIVEKLKTMGNIKDIVWNECQHAMDEEKWIGQIVEKLKTMGNIKDIVWNECQHAMDEEKKDDHNEDEQSLTNTITATMMQLPQIPNIPLYDKDGNLVYSPHAPHSPHSSHSSASSVNISNINKSLPRSSPMHCVCSHPPTRCKKCLGLIIQNENEDVTTLIYPPQQQQPLVNADWSHRLSPTHSDYPQVDTDIEIKSYNNTSPRHHVPVSVPVPVHQRATHYSHIDRYSPMAMATNSQYQHHGQRVQRNMNMTSPINIPIPNIIHVQHPHIMKCLGLIIQNENEDETSLVYPPPQQPLINTNPDWSHSLSPMHNDYPQVDHDTDIQIKSYNNTTIPPMHYDRVSVPIPVHQRATHYSHIDRYSPMTMATNSQYQHQRVQRNMNMTSPINIPIPNHYSRSTSTYYRDRYQHVHNYGHAYNKINPRRSRSRAAPIYVPKREPMIDYQTVNHPLPPMTCINNVTYDVQRLQQEVQIDYNNNNQIISNPPPNFEVDEDLSSFMDTNTSRHMSVPPPGPPLLSSYGSAENNIFAAKMDNMNNMNIMNSHSQFDIELSDIETRSDNSNSTLILPSPTHQNPNPNMHYSFNNGIFQT
eukprot:CAMPEP_0201591782 /NCGR_PEP_ID=MMETSP0190_2-20130828/189853_1 /ASSEMBLY_ACC=CAM_ASM_000263 /TAXON_ID=37353 /ORGANISM="Rosalina sp." /LENGTH=706 /DNA_ID=CAMNT_0048050253 /DNA_START=1300 /DNA_END=3424 /DNA_ORIENTATION=+